VVRSASPDRQIAAARPDRRSLRDRLVGESEPGHPLARGPTGPDTVGIQAGPARSAVRRTPRSYSGAMAAQPVMTAEEWFERMRHAGPPTDDDVTILWDGRRLDSREAVMEWLAEVEAKRAEEAAAAADAAT
jgi:hypothetical protein